MTRHHQSGKWQASINDGGDYFYAGLYPEEQQAARAFDISRLTLQGGGAPTSTSVNASAKAEGRRVGAQDDGAPQPRKQQRRSATNPVWFARKIRALNASLSPGARIAAVVQPGKP